MGKWVPLPIMASLLALGSSAATGRSQDSVKLLLVGNSFTVGYGSAAGKYHPELIRDLNGGGMGGVPAMLKRFTQEAGMRYDISVEAAFGRTLQWHWTHRREAINARWDKVVLQEQSMLSKDDPGNPADMIRYGSQITDALYRRNPRVQIALMSGWSRPDKIYPKGQLWSGKPVANMATDLQRTHEMATRRIGHVQGIAPVGIAFNRLIALGIADANPYDGIDKGKINLWAADHHHASKYGAYTTALVLFGTVTGKDPRSLGPREAVASELGIDPRLATTLQATAAQSVSPNRRESWRVRR